LKIPIDQHAEQWKSSKYCLFNFTMGAKGVIALYFFIDSCISIRGKA